MIIIPSFYITFISIVAILFAFLGFAKGIKNPAAMASSAITLIPFQMDCPFIGALKVNELAIIMWVLIFVLCAINQREVYVSKISKSYLSYLFLLLIFSLLNYLSVNNVETLVEYFRLFITILFPLTMTMLFGYQLKDNLNEMFIAWNTGATLVSLVSLIYIPLAGYSLSEFFRQYFITKTRYFYELKFASSPCIADPNSYAGYLAISLIITFYLFQTYKKKRYILTIALELLGLITSLSRGVILALIVVALIYCVVNKVTRWLCIFLIPAGTAVFVLYFIPYVRGDGSATSRFGLWATAINMFRQNPIFGVGLQNYTYFFNDYRSSSVTIDTPFTHNLYLKVLVETGAIGEIIFLYMCISSIVRGFKLKNIDNSCLVFALSILTFMIQGLSVEFFTSYFFWFVLVVGGVYTFMAQQDPEISDLWGQT